VQTLGPGVLAQGTAHGLLVGSEDAVLAGPVLTADARHPRPTSGMPRSRVRHSGAAAAWQISPSKGTAARVGLATWHLRKCAWPRPLLSSDNDSRDRLHLVCPARNRPVFPGRDRTGARSIYCSGQIPLDPETGELVGNGDVEKETTA